MRLEIHAKEVLYILSAFYFNDNAQPAGTGKDYRQIIVNDSQHATLEICSQLMFKWEEISSRGEFENKSRYCKFIFYGSLI